MKTHSPEHRPRNISQVTRFLRQHGIEHVELRRGTRYFFFTGGQADRWLANTVNLQKLDYLTLAQWLETFRQLEQQNAPGVNPFTGRKLGSKSEEPQLVRHNAKAWARERGHDLGRWTMLRGTRHQWKAGCRRCGRELVVTTDENSNPTYSGQAAQGNCPGIHA